MRKLIFLSFFIFCGLLTVGTQAQTEKKHIEVGIDEKLGNQIPMDLTFTSSDGNKVMLKDVIKKPTILSLVYFHCPGICSPLLNGLGSVIEKIGMKPGEDFQVLSISFDHTETPATAEKWKKNYMSAQKKQIPEKGWLFMTGDSLSIRKLTDAVGFYFKPDGRGDFIHAGTLIVLSPNGKVIRYLLGTEFLPFDVKMALTEAGKGTPMPTVNKLLAYCFSYDPKGKQYALNITRIAGTFIVVMIGVFATIMIIKGRKKRTKEVK